MQDGTFIHIGKLGRDMDVATANKAESNTEHMSARAIRKGTPPRTAIDGFTVAGRPFRSTRFRNGSAFRYARRPMQVIRGVESLPLSAEPAVVTIGMFDGVHRVHEAVIGRTVEIARDRGVRSVATTFDRHPKEVLTHGHEPRLLTTLEGAVLSGHAAAASALKALGIQAPASGQEAPASAPAPAATLTEAGVATS